MQKSTLSLKSTVTTRDHSAVTAEPVKSDPKQPPKRVDPHVLQTAFLTANLGKPIACFLISGIRLTGKLKQFDQYTLMLQSRDSIDSMIFKHAIASLQTLNQS